MSKGNMANKNGAEQEAFVRNKKKLNRTGIDVSKTKLKKYVKNCGIEPYSIVSSFPQPDESYIDENELRIYEIKYQSGGGSADEKMQASDFKVSQYKKIAKAIGLEKVSFTWIFSDYFKKDRYKDVLSYIKTIPDCDYVFVDDLEDI